MWSSVRRVKRECVHGGESQLEWRPHMMYRPGIGSRSTLKETRSMITDQASANQSSPGSGQEPTNVERRTLIGAGLAALLTAACSSPTENRAQLLSSSGLVTAAERDEGRSVPNDPF